MRQLVGSRQWAGSSRQKEVGGRQSAVGSVCTDPSGLPSSLPPAPCPPPTARPGITLMEILISMFVLLFGLMGVAAIFPVGGHYVVEGEKWDKASLLAQNAFDEIEARRMLNPEYWLYSFRTPSGTWRTGTSHVINLPQLPRGGNTAGGFFNHDPSGHAFVIDPLGTASGLLTTPPTPELDVFPFATYENPSGGNYNINVPNPWLPMLPGPRFPVRRVTLQQALNVPLQLEPASTIFNLRDDLSYNLPEQRDRPGVQMWAVDQTVSPPRLLSRQYKGEYSWLATVVPTRHRALVGMQPAMNIRDEYYDVSVAVFYKRDFPPTLGELGNPGSERLAQAQFLNQRELVIFDNNNPEVVNDAVRDIGPRNWIAVMGVNQSSGQFLMKWYRILAMDDETAPLMEPAFNNASGRYLTLVGPDWPIQSANVNLRVAILPGVIDVVTKPMQLHWE